MPPRARITRDMVVDAAFAIARAEGAEAVNARTVSQKLGCSTQPVMYHFGKIEDLKRAVYQKLDRFHTRYLLCPRSGEDGMLSIGLNYIRFAVEEPNLFRFLFQSGFAPENSVAQMLDAEALEPILSAMGEAGGLTMAQAKRAFTTLALFVHGYASLLANNPMVYDEEVGKAHLERAFRGAVLAEREEAE